LYTLIFEYAFSKLEKKTFRKKYKTFDLKSREHVTKLLFQHVITIINVHTDNTETKYNFS